ncbi:uncharacterized protein [Typha latifolia]|uniref:uncharacterized protein n=1 Tax=Typha latifolia TaxID=4733 RepID=UPI003C30787A
MNCYREDNLCCYFHPDEVIIGICAICLRERLLILASKQGHLSQNNDTESSFRILRRKPSISLPKVFALGSFLQRLESRHQRPEEDHNSDEGSLASLEDSFISIKFEENGNASWDKKKATSNNPSSNAAIATTAGIGRKEVRIVVEHAKRGQGVLRWRRKIGHLLQMASWKRSNKAATCHAGLGGKVEGAGIKGIRRGWMRSLTRRRTTNNIESR